MDIDLTFFIQLIIFLAVFAGLNVLILKPFLAVLQDREQRISGAKSEAERLSKLVVQDRDAYDTRIKEARAAASRERDALKTSGRDQGRKIITDTRNEVTEAMSDIQAKVGAEEKEAAALLESDIDGLARQVVEKVLGRRLA